MLVSVGCGGVIVISVPEKGLLVPHHGPLLTGGTQAALCLLATHLQPIYPRSSGGLLLSLESVSPVLAREGKLVSSVLSVAHLSLCHPGF